MHFNKRSRRVPEPSAIAVTDLLVELLGEEDARVAPDWVREAIIIAYQNGRYAEASAETFAATIL